MISWLTGVRNPSWEYLRDLFQDHRGVAVYTNAEGEVEIVKVSDHPTMYGPTSVLIDPRNLGRLKVSFLKLEDMVVFPLMNQEGVKALLNFRGWRAVEYFEGDQFLGAWVGYDCEVCEERQRSHLNVDPFSPSSVNEHLRIFGLDLVGLSSQPKVP
jgi:hypothetical protein